MYQVRSRCTDAARAARQASKREGTYVFMKARLVDSTARLATWRAAACRVSLFEVPCIVTSPPGGHCDALVNPANEKLEGTQFTPSECSRLLAPATTIIYPSQAVDGLVTDLGGPELANACRELSGVPTGGAAITPAFGELLMCYTHIVHACAPFFDKDNLQRWRSKLEACYLAAFASADEAGLRVLALPLLGAGARGAPAASAAAVAAAAAASWRAPQGSGWATSVKQAPVDEMRPPRGYLREMRFAVQDPGVAHVFSEAMDEHAALQRESPTRRREARADWDSHWRPGRQWDGSL